MAGGPRRCLVFSPGLSGHREVYARVIAKWLAARGVAVWLAADLSEAGRLATPLLEEMVDVLGVELVDLSGERDGGAAMTLRELRRLVLRTEAEATVFTEADDHMAALAAMAWPGARRIPGRLIGIFLRSTNYIYSPADGGAPARFGGRWSLFGRGRQADPRRFHEVLQPQRRLLATALCLDEHFVATAPPGHAWLPDISSAFDGNSDERSQPAAEAVVWRRRLEELLAGAGERPLLVYLGTAQRRRGYDRILSLALRTGAMVAHCGRLPADDDEMAGRLRAQLLAAGRLLELGGPYRSVATASATLQAARCVVLPYRSHLGSSGVMLQALAAGRPVLVPDEGLMGWRTRSFDLGETVDVRDDDALAAAFLRLHRRGPQPYATALASFMKSFSREQVEAALSAALGFGGSGARLPQASVANRPDTEGGS